MITYDISQILVWYWILAITIVLVTFVASVIHQEWIPIIWGGIISALLVIFAPFLEPVLFGWIVESSLVIMTLSLIFFILWILAITQGLFNSLVYGRVVA